MAQRKGRKKQEKIVLFPEVYTNAVKMTDAQFGALMRAVFAYRFEGILYEGDDLAVDVSFRAVAGQIDRYSDVCEANRNNATGEYENGAAECSESQRNTVECSENQRKPTPNPIPIPIPNPSPNPHTEGETNISPANVDNAFSHFWSAYPKKIGKQAARKAFDKAIKATDISTILKAIELQRQSPQWSKDNGQYIPNPATWLNQGRWDDETEVKTFGQAKRSDFSGLTIGTVL